MAFTKQEIQDEFNKLPLNWHNIYQWNRCSRTGYIEFISEIILDQFDHINKNWTDSTIRVYLNVSLAGKCAGSRKLPLY